MPPRDNFFFLALDKGMINEYSVWWFRIKEDGAERVQKLARKGGE